MDAVAARGSLPALPSAAVVVDVDGTAEMNDRCGAMFGFAAGAVPRLDALLSMRCLEDAARCGEPRRLQAKRCNGVPFTVDADATHLEDGALLVLVREISGPELLAETQRFLDAAFERAPIGMALFNTDGEYVRVNAALCAMLGRAADELLGRRDQEFTHPDDRQADVDAAWRILRGEIDDVQMQKRFVAADGSIVWAIANMAFVRDEERRPLCWFGQFQDISAQQAAHEHLRHLAEHDELTGVPNRRRLVEELGQRVLHAGRYGERGAVLLLDLDGFKAINDALGHARGDEVLVEVVRVLRERLRRSDLLARLGGDEFAVVLPHVDPAQAATVALDLVDAIAGAGHPGLSAGCGIALYGPEESSSPEDVLAAADGAMYEAKAAGPGQVRIAAGIRSSADDALC